MMIEIWDILRAIGYGVSVLLCLALAIEYGNQGDRPLAGVFASLALLHGILLLVTTVRFYGYADAAFSRVLATPVIALHVFTLALLTRRLTRGHRVA